MNSDSFHQETVSSRKHLCPSPDAVCTRGLQQALGVRGWETRGAEDRVAFKGGEPGSTFPCNHHPKEPETGSGEEGPSLCNVPTGPG